MLRRAFLSRVAGAALGLALSRTLPGIAAGSPTLEPPPEKVVSCFCGRAHANLSEAEIMTCMISGAVTKLADEVDREIFQMYTRQLDGCGA